MLIYKVIITRYPSRGQSLSTKSVHKTYEDALKYANEERPYPCKIQIIKEYLVEEIINQWNKN